MIQYKTTRQLFNNKYQYKIVLVCSNSQYFRSGDPATIAESLTKAVRPKEDISYGLQLVSKLNKMQDYNIRVESPWISLYTNSKADVDRLKDIDPDKVKYICQPPANTKLEEGVVIMTNTDFDYKVTLGKTSSENTAFIDWASSNKKVKLTKSCARDLKKIRSWGGTHFFISGDNNLLLAKMHLGGSISKVEKIIKSAD